MRADVFVVSTPAADGERFAILRHDTISLAPFVWPSSLEDWRSAFDRYLESVARLREEDVRAQLTDMGLSTEAVDHQLRRARHLHFCNEQTTWERTTAIGYRNEHGQVVIQKTALHGSLPDQRVYVLRCGDCGHEYGANGSELHLCRCPQCQGGSPGLTA
jgi:hypothetical protein